jgi:hypothetical protein
VWCLWVQWEKREQYDAEITGGFRNSLTVSFHHIYVAQRYIDPHVQCQLFPRGDRLNYGSLSVGATNLYCCSCSRTHICRYASMYVCTYIRTYVRMYARMYVCKYVCTHVCTYVCMYVYMYEYVCMYVRMYVCMHVCTYVCMYVYMYEYVRMYARMYVCMYVCVYVWSRPVCACTYMD